MNWDFVKPIAAQFLRDFLRTVGMALLSHGAIKDGAGVEAFVGAGMTFGGLVWGWWTTTGHVQAEGLLKKLTAAKTTQDAVKAAQVLPAAAAVDTQAKALSAQSVAK